MNLPGNSIDISEEDGIRSLHFGSEWVQGAMRVRRPYALELAYTREMAAGLILRAAPPRRVLLIGLGAGSLAKFFWKQVPEAKITVVEIDPRVVAAAQMHFRLPPEDGRLAIVIGDGADYVTRRCGHWDAILVDGFDHRARAGVLDTAPFYEACRAALSPQGLMAANLFGERRGFRASFKRIETAFDQRAIAFPASDSGNVIAFANAGEALTIGFDELKARAKALKAARGLDLVPTVKKLAAASPHEGLTL